VSEPPLDIMKDPPRDRFAVAVAVLAVVTTLVAAGVGLLFAMASNAGDRASARAQERSLDAVAGGVRADKRVERALGLFELSAEQRAHATTAFGDAPSAGHGSRRELIAEAARWSAQATRSERDLGGQLATGEGPDGVYFPARLRNAAERQALVTVALRDADNELASAWGKRGGTYAAILTLLTVALYLFGFSLTPQGRDLRGLFAGVGLVFLTIGVVFGPVKALSGQPSPSRHAAEAFADAEVRSANATLSGSKTDWQAARRLYDEAIRDRPSFAAAYLGRATAIENAASPEFVAGTSLTTQRGRGAAINDLRMAQALGLQSPLLLTDLGFDLVAQGIVRGDRQALQQGTAVTREALAEYAKADTHRGFKRAPGCGRSDVGPGADSTTIFNLGVALLAAHRVADARREYERGICATLAGGADPESASRSESYGALTDLELVARYGPIDLRDDVLALKELVVGSIARGALAPPAPTTTRLRGVTIFIEAGYVTFTVARPQGLSPATWKDNDNTKRRWLSAQWYHRDTSGPGGTGIGWSNLRQINGPVQLFAPDSQGHVFAFSSYIGAVEARCLPDGQYRVELYDQGRLVGAAEAAYAQSARFTAFRDPLTAMVGCRPVDWVPANSSMTRGFRDPQTRRGMYLVRMDDVARDLDLASPATARQVVERAIARGPVRFPGLHPITPENLDFAGLGGSRSNFEYRGGRITSGVGRDSDGSVVAGLVYGPRDYFDRPRSVLIGEAQPYEIVGSMAIRYDTAAPKD
jgi:hypothetical protein